MGLEMECNERIKKLSQEWAIDNEKPLDAYSMGSHVKGWWTCGKGHQWTARIRTRFEGTDCPYCSGRLAITGETDLQTVDPNLSAQWDPVRNNDLTPSDITPYSNRKVWWICKKGHSWEATVAKRSMGKGCPYCGHKLADEKNNLAILYPDIAAEWDKERNGCSAADVLPHSNMYASWVCRNGHRWIAVVNSRTRATRPCGCPYCSGRVVIPGETDLITTNPELAAEWNKERNLFTPDRVSRYSHKKIYWNCQNGHVYKMTVANRAQGKECPVCFRRRMKYGKI